MDDIAPARIAAPVSSANYQQYPQLDDAADAQSLLIMLISGNEDAGKRATLAFAAACSSLAMNSPTSVFLVGDGVRWSYNRHIDNVRVSGFPALRELVEMFTDLGGNIVACSTCSLPNGSCSLNTGLPGDENRMRSDIAVQGFASALSFARRGRTLTF